MQTDLSVIYNSDNFSKILSLSRYAKVGNPEYNQLLTLEGDVQSTEVTHTNTISGDKLFFNEEKSEEYLRLMISLMGKHSHFVPLIEVPGQCSSLAIILETKLKYDKSHYDEVFTKLEDDIRFVCKQVYKFMKTKYASFTAIYVKSFDRKILVKLQFLSFVMNYSNKHAITEKVRELLLANSESVFSDVMLPDYNEFHETTTFPIVFSDRAHYYWKFLGAFECKQKLGLSISLVSRERFLEIQPMKIFSINLTTDVPRELINIEGIPLVESESEKTEEQRRLMRILYTYPRVQFMKLVLDNLPNEYKTGDHVTKIINSMKYERNAYLLAKSVFADKCDNFNKLWNKQKQEPYFGYYTSLVQNIPAYRDGLKHFTESILESTFYDRKGKVPDTVVAMIVNFAFYGKYYTFERPCGGRFEVQRYEFVDLHDEAEEKYLYKWKQFSLSKNIHRFLTEEIPRSIESIKSRTGLVGNSYSKDPKEKEIGKMLTAFSSFRDRISQSNGYESVIKHLVHETLSPLFSTRINSDKTVIGTLNGILDLDVESSNPQPKLYTGYSPFVVTKSVDAKYIPYEKLKLEAKYLPKIKKSFKDIYPDRDSRKKFFYFLSTCLDEVALKDCIFMVIGWGGNGKSYPLDALLILMNCYATKLSPTLFTAGRIGGRADTDFMPLSQVRFGLAAETNKEDKLVAARLKSITEVVKEGRSMFKDPENFKSNPTVVLCSNYELELSDNDHGTSRRIYVLKARTRFVYNPDPNNPNERLVDPSLGKMFINSRRARDEYFSWLVHIRCKFQRLYGSNIHKVPSELVDRDTEAYKCEKDPFSRFILTRVVIMIGYNEECKLRPDGDKSQAELLAEIDRQYEECQLTISHKMSLDTLTTEFNIWRKRMFSVLKEEPKDSLTRSFKQSALGKYIQGENDQEFLVGVRVLEWEKVKEKGEMHIPR
jgi:phage/plasmid-associated DNA primase